MPSGLEEAHSFAIVHLASLVSEMDEAQQDRLARELQGLGVTAAPLLLEIVQGNRVNRQIDFEAKLATSPDDETLLSLIALWGRNAQRPDSVPLAAWRGLRERRRELSWLAALQLAWSPDADAAAAFVETAAALESLENLPVLVLGAVSNAVAADPQQAGEMLPVCAAAANRLRSKLPGWYRKADPANYAVSGIFFQLAVQLSRADDLEPMIRLLEEEIKSGTDDPQRKARTAAFFGGRNSNRLLEPLRFPPQMLPSFPAGLLSLLSGDPNNHYGRQLGMDPDKLRAVLPKVTSPLLRVLLTSRLDDTEAVTKLLSELASADDAGADVLFTAAAWAAYHGQPADAVGLMRRALAQPLAREVRKLADASIVVWALEGIDSRTDRDNDPLVASARESILRLRREAINLRQRDELAEAMQQAGLTREAGRFAAASALTGPGASAAAPVFLSRAYPIPLPLSPTGNRIDQLVEKGRRSDAVKQLTRELKIMARSWKASGQNNSRQQAREWMEAVIRHGFEKELLLAADPGNDESADALAQWAASLEILGETKRAIDAYRRALAKKPNDDGLRRALVVAMIDEDPAEAAAMVKECTIRQITSMGFALQNLVQQTHGHEDRLALLQTIAGMLEKLTADDWKKLNLEPLMYCVEAAAQTGWANDDHVPLGSLYHEPVGTPPDRDGLGQALPDERAVSLARQRREWHQKICSQLLNCPPLARRAFQRFAGVAMAHAPKTAPEELQAMAIKALECEKAAAGAPTGLSYSTGGEDQKYIRMPYPEDWLLERAWETKNELLITGFLLPKLKAAGHGAAATLEARLPLFFCPPQEFGPVAASHARTKLRPSPLTPGPSPWAPIFRVIQLRRLEADLSGPLLESFKRGAPGVSGQPDSWAAGEYAAHLRSTKGIGAAEEFLTRLAAVYLGPVERRAGFIKNNFNSNGYNSRPLQWLQILRAGMARPELTFLLFESYEREFVPYASSVAEDQLFNHSHALQNGRLIRRSPDKVIDLLRGTPLMAPLERFNPCHGLGRSDRSLCGDVLRELIGGDDKKRQELLEAVRKEPRTFGTELVQLALEKRHAAAAVLTVADRHLDAIKALPEDRRRPIARFCAHSETSFGTVENSLLTDGIRKARTWAREAVAADKNSEATTFLALKSLRRVPNSYDGQLNEQVRRFTGPLIGTQPDQAVRIFLKARELVADARKGGMGSNSGYGDGRSVLGNALQQMLNLPPAAKNSEAYSQAALRFAMTVSSHPEGYPIEWSHDTVTVIGNVMVELGSWPPYVEPHPAAGPTRTGFSFRHLLPRLRAAGVDKARLTLVPLVALMVQRQPVEDERKWLEAQASAAGADRHGATLMLYAARLATKYSTRSDVAPLTSARSAGIPDPAALPPEQKAAHMVLQDAAIPAAVRAGAAGLLLESGRMEPAVIVAAAHVVEEALRSAEPVTQSTVIAVMNGLTSLRDGASDLPSPEFVSSATSLLKTWQHAAGPRRSGGKFGWQGLTMGPEMAQAAFSLALAARHDSAINALISSAADSMDRQWLVRLLHAEQFEIARKLLRCGQPAMFNRYEATKEFAWSPALAAAAQKMADGFDNEEDEFMARLLTASLHDNDAADKGAAETHHPRRAARLSELAARMPLSFKNPVNLERALALFLEEKEVPAAVAERLAAWAATQNLAVVAQSDDYHLRHRRATLLTAHLRSRIAAGDAAAMCEALRQLMSGSGGRRSHNLRESAQPIWELCQKELPAIWQKADPETRRLIRETWRDLAFGSRNENVFGDHDGRRLLRAMMLYADDNRMAEFAAAVAEQSAVSRRRDALALAGADPVEELKDAAWKWPEAKAESARTRSQFLMRMMDNGLGWPGDKKYESRWLRTMIEREWLVRDDVLAAAASLMERHPRAGQTAHECAALLAEAGRTAEALAALDKAAAAMKGASPHGIVQLAEARAEVLERLDRSGEALAALEAVPAATLASASVSKELRERVGSLQSRLRFVVSFRDGGLKAALAPLVPVLHDKMNDEASWRAAVEALSHAASLHRRMGDHKTAINVWSCALLTAFRARREHSDAEWNEQITRIAASLVEARGAAGETAVGFTPVPRAAAWRYLDDKMPADAPDQWMQPDFDDASWKSGAAPLGCGVGDLIKTTTALPQIMWLRHHFSIDDPAAVKSLTLEFMRGDGLIVYLNGKEILRSNLADGKLKPSTRAAESVTHAEGTTWRTTKVGPGKLIALQKSNVLAIALYQFNEESEGCVFALEARANELESSEVRKSIDAKAVTAALGDAWAQLPGAFRKKVLE